MKNTLKYLVDVKIGRFRKTFEFSLFKKILKVLNTWPT